MPGYRGHIVIAILCFATIIYFFALTMLHFSIFIPNFVFCILGALFPDVDVKSKGQKVFYSMLLFFLWYCLCTHRWNLFITATFLGLLPLLVKHRGLFHKLWFLMLLTIGSIVGLKSCCIFTDRIWWQTGFFFLLGATSHVCADRIVSFFKRIF